ncbi:hypothetical protein [Streptomyces mutabilis]|uniref:hypothetical protein n=1 Tax=Streptomyces mutabilis TaxID=67332 RepID=UPI000A874061|nr:hypothetical protein [Streptomyces mutabilis]
MPRQICRDTGADRRQALIGTAGKVEGPGHRVDAGGRAPWQGLLRRLGAGSTEFVLEG